MIVLQIEMSAEFGELFAAVLKRIEKTLDGELPQSIELPDDPELAELWSIDLKEQLLSDLYALSRVLNHPDFGDGEIQLEEADAEKLLRAISASRLGIRRLELGSIQDADLEGGFRPLDEMPESLRIPYLCYLFLAGLQETLIQALDPETMEFLQNFSHSDFKEEPEDEVDPPKDG